SGWACTCSRESRSFAMRPNLPGAFEGKGLDIADAAYVPYALRNPDDGLVTDLSAELGGCEHDAGHRQLGQTARQVDDRSVVVTVARHDRSGRDARPYGEQF